MKVVLKLCVLLVLFNACNKVDHKKTMDQLESLTPIYSDSAYNGLKALGNTELSGPDLIRWSLLYSHLADSLGKPMPSDTILERSARFLRMNEKENIRDNAYINHYLGRAYAKAGKNEDALATYLYVLEMLEKAADTSLTNLLGYTYSYAADLYLKEYDPKQARLFYRKAASNFEKARNNRSEAIAYRDLAKCSSFEKDFPKALEYALIADSMAQSINEPILHASLANYLGGIYTNIGKYKEAEKSIRRAINVYPQNGVFHYLALSELYLKQARYQDANLLLDSVSSLINSPQRKLAVLNYRYKIERKLGNYNNALAFLEQERIIADSIRTQNQAQTLYEVEQKYAQEQLMNANNQLQIKYQQVVIVVIALILLLLIIFFLFRAKEHKRSRNELLLKQELAFKEQESEKQQLLIREQELLAQTAELAIQAHEKELKDVRKRFSMMKDALFQKSMLYEKIKLISNLPVKEDLKKKKYDTAIKDVFGDPSLSEQDWENLKRITNEFQPGFTDKLKEKVPSLSVDEVNFCCLLRFDLTTENLALLLNITPNTIKSKRYRIMQKAGLTNQNIRLESFLESIE